MELTMGKKKEISAMIGALMVLLIGAGFFYYISSGPESAPTSSVTGQERQNKEPAGPADATALPGDQAE
jgi:flagellar basal body-associated protein FliL